MNTSDDRLKDLEKRLDTSLSQRQGEKPDTTKGSAAGLAMRAVTELMVGIAVCMGLGWMVDRYFGTAPWVMLALMPFGIAAGVVNACGSQTANRLRRFWAAKARWHLRSKTTMRSDGGKAQRKRQRAQQPNTARRSSTRSISSRSIRSSISDPSRSPIPDCGQSSRWSASALLFLLAPKNLIPTRLQSVAESIYEFIENMTKEVLHENARTYFPFVLTLFTFILFCNVLGLIPYAFTVTSHIIVTLALALIMFIGATIIGFIRNGFAISSCSCRQACRQYSCRSSSSSRLCPTSSAR